MSVSRRQLLIALASVAPSAMFMTPALENISNAETGNFLKISQIITGNRHLNQAVSLRIEQTLLNRIANFSFKLNQLASNLLVPGDRDTLLGRLSAEETDFAFEIAKPWYLGFVGHSKGNILSDDTEFETYLHARSYEVT